MLGYRTIAGTGGELWIIVSEIMRRIKGHSSTKLFESFPDLKKRYWGRHFWARVYFCVIFREVTEEVIRHYLEHHFEPKADDNFRTEG